MILTALYCFFVQVWYLILLFSSTVGDLRTVGKACTNGELWIVILIDSKLWVTSRRLGGISIVGLGSFYRFEGTSWTTGLLEKF